MVAAKLLRVERLVRRLPPSDQQILYHRLAMALIPSPSPSAVIDIRERRFADGFRCPRCHSDHVQRHGRYKKTNRWRYRCIGCGKTFNDATASPMAGTHYDINRWLRYAWCMSQGKSTRHVLWK